jgi:DNA polymerase delta subunit 1
MVEAKGASPEEAFRFGEEAAAAASEYLNRTLGVQGLLLEFECVMMPFLLLKKKRYTAMKYEKLSQMLERKGEVYMKGIETQRRDSCGLVRRVLTEVLTRMMRDTDVGGALGAVARAVDDLMRHRVDLSELMVSTSLTRPIAEYKGKQGVVELARKMKARDPATAPMIGTRFPYVVVAGTSKTKMYELYEDPRHVLRTGMQVHAAKYLEKLEKSVMRILGVVRLADTKQIFASARHSQSSVKTSVREGGNALTRLFGAPQRPAKRARLEIGYEDEDDDARWTVSRRCVVCRTPRPQGLGGACDDCADTRPTDVQVAFMDLQVRCNDAEATAARCMAECQRCAKTVVTDVVCGNVDCAIFFRRTTSRKDANNLRVRIEEMF